MSPSSADPADPNGGMEPSRGSRPVPDPTELTDRAIAKLKEQMTQYVDGQVEVLTERLRGVDEATSLRLRTIDGIPDQISKEINHLRVLQDEKFLAVQTQFRERDTRSERESRDNKVAVDAAFAAQKEAAATQDSNNAKAIDKSEKATAETIKTNQELNSAKTDSLTKGLDEIKLAVNSILSSKAGNIETRTEAKDNRTALYASIGLVISVTLAAITILGAIVALKP